MTYVLAAKAHLFATASEALTAGASHDSSTEDFFQYECRAVFGNADRDLLGYQLRVMDLDGFAKGYVIDGSLADKNTEPVSLVSERDNANKFATEEDVRLAIMEARDGVGGICKGEPSGAFRHEQIEGENGFYVVFLWAETGRMFLTRGIKSLDKIEVVHDGGKANHFKLNAVGQKAVRAAREAKS